MDGIGHRRRTPVWPSPRGSGSSDRVRGRVGPWRASGSLAGRAARTSGAGQAGDAGTATCGAGGRSPSAACGWTASSCWRGLPISVRASRSDRDRENESIAPSHAAHDKESWTRSAAHHTGSRYDPPHLDGLIQDRFRSRIRQNRGLLHHRRQPYERYAMTRGCAVLPLQHPEEPDDPLTAVLREGARRLSAHPVDAEPEAFPEAMRRERLADGRARIVRHGHGSERAAAGSVSARHFHGRLQGGARRHRPEDAPSALLGPQAGQRPEQAARVGSADLDVRPRREPRRHRQGECRTRDHRLHRQVRRQVGSIPESPFCAAVGYPDTRGDNERHRKHRSPAIPRSLGTVEDGLKQGAGGGGWIRTNVG